MIPAKLKKTYNYFIRIVLIIVSYGFIYRELFQKRDINELLSAFTGRIDSDGFYFILIVVFLLIIVNWLIEARKWQFLLKKIEKIPLLRSFYAVLTGISVSLFTPNRMGEYFGRIFILEKANHWEGIFVTVVGSFSQLITTLVCGVVGAAFFLPGYIDLDKYLFGVGHWGIYFTAVVSVAFFLMIFFNISLFSRILDRLSKREWTKFRSHVKVFQSYTTKELTHVISLSFARYLVFNFQYYLLLKVLGVPIPILDSFMLTSVMYFVLAIIPTIALTELGIRGMVSIALFEYYFQTKGIFVDSLNIAVFTASSTLWLINIIIPAILGTIFVYRLKFFRR